MLFKKILSHSTTKMVKLKNDYKSFFGGAGGDGGGRDRVILKLM